MAEIIFTTEALSLQQKTTLDYVSSNVLKKEDVMSIDLSNVVGLHGCSIETVIDLILNGGLIGNTTVFSGPEDRTYRIGTLAFYPLREALPDYSPQVAQYFLDGVEEAFSEAEVYANMLGQTHYFMDVLGLSKKDERLNVFSRTILDDGIDYIGIERSGINELAREIGVSPQAILAVRAKAQERKGIVLVLSKQIINDFTIDDGDAGTGDLRIQTEGRRLPYRYILNFIPLGDVEAEFFQQLEKLK